ncbi:hypothetical protein ACL02S_18765 [Nocardia sp. 004]|uniref:hypothetical protein n=1 Tax=Nocardia sp. 004 TaxID=3385978 RepID=UPI00399EE93C
MPKRTSDVSLHVYVTPETLERVVDTVRAVVDDHLLDRDLFAWHCTVPVDTDDPAHLAFERHCRTAGPGDTPDEQRTYEIALSLVGTPDQWTDHDTAKLEQHLRREISGLTRDEREQPIPLSIRARQRTAVDLDLDRANELR